MELYLLKILHQTTTGFLATSSGISCIYLKFYIKPQHPDNCERPPYSCIYLKFYIKPQQYKVPYAQVTGCIYLKFYIKPQLGQTQYA